MDQSQKIKHIPTGYSEVNYMGKKYGVSRTDFNNGRSTKIFAKELGGKKFISFNFYFTEKLNLLKPCEMPEQDVIHFLKNYKKLF